MAPYSRTLVRPDVAASAPSSDAYGLVVRFVGGGTVAIGSTATRVTNPTWLTDTQLAARLPLPVQFSSTQQIVVGEVEIKNDSGNPVPVTATALDITLSALRSAITAGATLDSIVAALASVYGRQADGSQVTVLGAGAATVGKVDQGAAGSASWKMTSTGVKLAAGAAVIGSVGQSGAPWAVTSTGTKLVAGTATIGKVDQGAAGTGSWPFTSTSVKLAAGAAQIGTVDLSAAALAALEAITVQNTTSQRVPGRVTQDGAPWAVTSTSVKLAAGAAAIGAVAQGVPGSSAWPIKSTGVKLAAGSAAIGVVAQGAAGAASWPVTSTSVKLAAGAATVGKVDQGAAGAAAWPVKSTGVVVTNTTRSLSAATLAALESISVQNTTAAAIPTAEQNTLVPKKYGCIVLSYSTFVGSTSRKLTSAVYKVGSSTTATVATLTLAYSTLLQLASVART